MWVSHPSFLLHFFYFIIDYLNLTTKLDISTANSKLVFFSFNVRVNIFLDFLNYAFCCFRFSPRFIPRFSRFFFVFGWAQSGCFSLLFSSRFTFFSFLTSLYKCVRESVAMFECKCLWVCECMEEDVNSQKKRWLQVSSRWFLFFLSSVFFCFHFLKNLRRDYIAFIYSTYVFHEFFFLLIEFTMCVCVFLKEKKTPSFLLVFLNFLFLRVITFI